MSQSARKFIAVLLALWLPFFSGSVLAASVSMQLSAGQMQQSHADIADMAMPDIMPDMQHGDGCEHHTVSSATQDHGATQHHHGTSCNACGVCHLACSGYLAVSALSGLTVQQPGALLAVYLLSFDSITNIPLLPPPLVRA